MECSICEEPLSEVFYLVTQNGVDGGYYLCLCARCKDILTHSAEFLEGLRKFHDKCFSISTSSATSIPLY